MDFDSVADELHVAPRSEFVPTRDRRSRQARDEDDHETAERIAKLRKPTVAAWLLNLLAHERPELMQRYLALGDPVREGSGLQEFATRRRDLLQELLGEVESVAREHDQPLNSGTTREITDTLNRALADAGAAGTVRAGRLSSALPASGELGEQWLASVAAQHGPPSTSGKRKSSHSNENKPRSRARQPATSSKGEQREHTDREAERALDQAQQRLDRAEQDAEQARRQAEYRRRELDRAERHREQADEDLRAARSERDAAAKTVHQRRD